MATKVEIVTEIVRELATSPRKEVIAAIIERAGMTPAGASTYYYNVTKKLREAGVALPAKPKATKKKLLESTAAAQPKKETTTKAASEIPSKEDLKQQAEKFIAWRKNKQATVARGITGEELEEESEVPEWEWSIEDQEEAKELLRVQMG